MIHNKITQLEGVFIDNIWSELNLNEEISHCYDKPYSQPPVNLHQLAPTGHQSPTFCELSNGPHVIMPVNKVFSQPLMRENS